MNERSSFQHHLKDESIYLREQFERYLKKWPWFVLSIFVAMVVVTLYLRYAQPQYKASASILVRDDRKGNFQSELSQFDDLGLMNVKSNVDNEIEIIKSRSIVENAVKKLQLNVAFYTEGRVKTVEMYDNLPVDVSFFGLQDSFYTKPQSFMLSSQSATTYTLKDINGTSLGVYNYGAVVPLSNFKLVLVKKAIVSGADTSNYSIIMQINALEQVVQSFKNQLIVTPLSKNSSVVDLSLTDAVPQKAEDLLDAIIEIYNQDAIDDKNYISRNTQSFIEERLKFISNELGTVEEQGESFMRKNKITDVVSNADVFFNNSVEFERSLIETETQIKVVYSMIDYMNNASKEGIIPTNIIPSGNSTNSTGELINQYNSLVVQKNRLKSSGTSKNIVLVDLSNRMEEMRKSIDESLNRLLVSHKIKRDDLKKQDELINRKIAQVPGQSREIGVIGRQQKIKETLYLYLLQKREEVGISLAVTAPNAKIIDSAKATKAPISPNRGLAHLIGLITGLLVPFSVLFIHDFIDTKIKSRRDFDGIVSIPYLGDIPKSDSSDEIIKVNSRTPSAEAIRIIRTNLDFILGTLPENQCKAIFVTSSIPKEGKTFVSANLAATIALTSKKVLIIGLDIRNPKLNYYMDLPEEGITNYLAKGAQNIHDYIVKIDGYDSFYALPSGIVPPNPVELLSTSKIEALFELLKKEYDYIVVDTPPVSLVTDTMLIAKNADAFVYVVRAHYLDKRMLPFIEDLYQQKKIPNMSLVLNDTEIKKSYGYGYGYGYGYEQDVLIKKTLLSTFLGYFKKKY